MLLVLAAMALIDFFDPVDTSLAQAVPGVQLIHSILILAPVPVQQYPLSGGRGPKRRRIQSLQDT